PLRHAQIGRKPRHQRPDEVLDGHPRRSQKGNEKPAPLLACPPGGALAEEIKEAEHQGRDEPDQEKAAHALQGGSLFDEEQRVKEASAPQKAPDGRKRPARDGPGPRSAESAPKKGRQCKPGEKGEVVRGVGKEEQRAADKACRFLKRRFNLSRSVDRPQNPVAPSQATVIPL